MKVPNDPKLPCENTIRKRQINRDGEKENRAE